MFVPRYVETALTINITLVMIKIIIQETGARISALLNEAGSVVEVRPLIQILVQRRVEMGLTEEGINAMIII